MRIYKKAQPLNANLMYDSSLDIVSEFKDLGLLVSYNLCRNSHINRIVSNANRMLGLISRTCKGLFDVLTVKTLLFIGEIPAGVQLGGLVTSHQEEH